MVRTIDYVQIMSTGNAVDFGEFTGAVTSSTVVALTVTEGYNVRI